MCFLFVSPEGQCAGVFKVNTMSHYRFNESSPVVLSNHFKPYGDRKKMRRALMKIRSMHNPVRQKILNLLYDRASMTVMEIVFALRVDQPTVSQHLKILRGGNIVWDRRIGTNVYYSLNREECERITNIVRKFNDQ